MIIGVALCSTALGTLLPILRDAGESKSPIGIAVTALGAVGEFGPPVTISLFFMAGSWARQQRYFPGLSS